jgi:nitrite reductase/ring-hydroxylating ferredoxin subunit
VDYVGRAHTSRGADANIYIAERYVIGMVGFVQHAIIDALMRELEGYDDDLEMRAIKAWNKLCMVILEMLARAYGDEREGEALGELMTVDARMIYSMSVESYEKGLGLQRPMQYKDTLVSRAADIPEGERKIIEVDGVSIGIFHHKGGWYALRNRCLHRGGPVATGSLVDDHIICPWHGYTYNLTDGSLLMDPSAHLEMYPVTLRGGEVFITVPQAEAGDEAREEFQAETTAPPALKVNEFKLSDVPPGKTALVHLNGRRVAVFNVDGKFYATQDECTHARGPLSEGELEGRIIVCPWHFSRFDVTNGVVMGRPAKEPLTTFKVIVEGETGRVEG